MSDVDRAVAALRAGGLVAFPTETVYGLGADASNADAVRSIFAAKGRPADRPLTVHLGPNGDPSLWGFWSEDARRLAAAFWPGPLTLVVRRTPIVPDIVTAGGDTVGIRVPAHPLAMELLDAFGGGVAAPSANRSGGMSPTTALHVREDLGTSVDVILDGGTCDVGVESTVLLLSTLKIVRSGAVTADDIERVLGRPVTRTGAMTGTHYATRTPLRIVASVPREPGRIAVIGGPPVPGVAHHPMPTDPTGYARLLYEVLRAADGLGVDAILVVAPPRGGLWDAIHERLAASAAASQPSG